MATEQGPSGQDVDRSPVRRPRWRYVYFLLAAFDLLTVSAGLYLNQRIMTIYVRSVEVNRVWAARVAAYSHLGELAAEVNAPGNDVFDNHNVQAEAMRMHAAERIFDFELTQQERELNSNVEAEVAAPLLARLNAVAVAKEEMVAEAARIFTHFRGDRPDLAGARMATMDHKYAYLNAALLELRRAVGNIQEQHFAEQTAAAADLQRYEYAIGLSIVLMVLGATYYGHKLARQMQADSEERERHYTELGAAEARTRAIIETAAEGIISFDREGRIVAFNDAAARLFGYESGGAIGRSIRSMVPALAQCTVGQKADSDADPAARVRHVLGGEGVGRRSDGTEFALGYSVSTINFHGVPTFTGIVRDLSDRIKAEKAQGAADAAEAANRAKSQFLANMSHEIRTPMYAVLGMTELLLGTRLTPSQRRYAETVHRSGESLLGIINSVLDFSKIEAGKVALEHVEFRLREVTAEVVQLFQEGAAKKGLDLVCQVGDDIAETFVGAPSHLRQVLINLVGNAIKFTDHGAVEIDVSLADAAEDAATDDSEELRFVVTDTGIGIAASAQQRLFQAFEQADSSTTRRYGGTGLGLAISKELVEKMGGQIGMRSEPGKGAEFWFTVRFDAALRPGTALEPSSDAAISDGGLRGIRVLLAEDNAINQEVTRSLLNTLGCRVHAVDTGAQALAALEKSQYDIVLMDRQMPEMDGLDATAAIRARGLMRPDQAPPPAAPVRLPIVGLTASALKGDREVCISAGMDDYLAKPVRCDALRRVLDRWVLDRNADVSDTAGPARADAAAGSEYAVLDQIRRNRRGGGIRAMNGLIDNYFKDAESLIDTLGRASELADTAMLAHAAHSLAVDSEFVGARGLAQRCVELERAALESDMRELGQKVAGVRQEFESVRREIEAMRAGGGHKFA